MQNTTKIATIANGVPTSPDVKKLIANFGIPQEEVPIKYTDIAKVIGAPYKSGRFRTVTTAWRRFVLAKYGVKLITLSGQAFVAATHGEWVQKSSNNIQSKLHGIVKTSKEVATYVDPARLDSDDRRQYEKTSHIGGVLKLAAATEARKYAKPVLGKGE